MTSTDKQKNIVKELDNRIHALRVLLLKTKNHNQTEENSRPATELIQQVKEVIDNKPDFYHKFNNKIDYAKYPEDKLATKVFNRNFFIWQLYKALEQIYTPLKFNSQFNEFDLSLIEYTTNSVARIRGGTKVTTNKNTKRYPDVELRTNFGGDAAIRGVDGSIIHLTDLHQEQRQSVVLDNEGNEIGRYTPEEYRQLTQYDYYSNPDALIPTIEEVRNYFSNRPVNRITNRLTWSDNRFMSSGDTDFSHFNDS